MRDRRIGPRLPNPRRSGSADIRGDDRVRAWVRPRMPTTRRTAGATAKEAGQWVPRAARMNESDVSVFCRQCGANLTGLVPTSGEPEDGRKPCPECGSTSREFELNLEP